MKSLLSLSVIVPSKSVKNMYFGFLNGQFMALSSDAEAIAGHVLMQSKVLDARRKDDMKSMGLAAIPKLFWLNLPTVLIGVCQARSLSHTSELSNDTEVPEDHQR